MICKIADLITDVPASNGLDIRCRDYLCECKDGVDIRIHTELYRRDRYSPYISEEQLAYMEAAYQFYVELVKFGGLYLHSSAVAIDDKAYLFSGPCGTGKSTHTRLWQQIFGEKAEIINDDKPAMRRIDGHWYAYGTPWCGKDGININRKVSLAGICFLQQAEENRIRRLTKQEAMQKILSQTIFKFFEVEKLDLMLSHLEKLVQEIPVYEFENRPEPEAAWLSYETMRCGAQEAGL